MDITSFLQDSLEHLESQISLLDNKSSILSVVQGALLAIIAFPIREIIVGRASPSVIALAILTGAFLFGAVTIMLLVQTIRPARWFLGLEDASGNYGIQELRDVA